MIILDNAGNEVLRVNKTAGTTVFSGNIRLGFLADSAGVLTNNGTGTLSWAAAGVGAGYTNLTQFVDQTNWSVFYSNGSGEVTELTVGAAGKVLTGNGVTSAPTWETPTAKTFSKSFVITNPTASSDLPLWRADAACTITAVHLLCKTQIIVGQLWEYDANGLNGATVDASDITGVIDTNVNDDGALSNGAIASGNYVGWKTTSATVGATYAIITFEGTYT